METPTTATSQFIQAGKYCLNVKSLLTDEFAPDDDDLDEEALPSFSGPSLPSDNVPNGADKGKGRATDANAISGNIGSSTGATNANNGVRRMVGGVRVETRCVTSNSFGLLSLTLIRYTGVDTLDEPVTTTIVSGHLAFPVRASSNTM